LAVAAVASAAAADPSVAAVPQVRGDMLTKDDHKRIAAAIDKIESQTSGDIYCLVAHEASNYREVPLAWASIVVILVPALFLATGRSVVPYLADLEGWSAVPAQDVSHWLLLWILVQAALFAVAALLVSISPIRRVLTPHFLKRHRVRTLARQHFISTGLHLEPHQPHVLIFLALAERVVEIVADPAVHKLTGEKVWHEARDAVVSGMQAPDPAAGLVHAIEIAGAPLIAHFPATRPLQHREGLAEV
jgi:putative membrane protein